jgi:hypothetical protein
MTKAKVKYVIDDNQACVQMNLPGCCSMDVVFDLQASTRW